MSAIYESDCPECDGDGYQERFNDDQDGVITWLCPACDGTGKRRRGGDAMTPDEDTVVAALRNYAIRAPQDEGLAAEAEREYLSLAREVADLREWAERAAEGIERAEYWAGKIVVPTERSPQREEWRALLSEWDAMKERP